LTPEWAGVETQGYFTHILVQGDPEVSAAGKPWRNSWDRPPSLTVWTNIIKQQNGRMGNQTQLLTPALAGAEARRSFAHIYAQDDPEVSAPGKSWRKSWDQQPSLTV
jgi:hypothetical protein